MVEAVNLRIWDAGWGWKWMGGAPLASSDTPRIKVSESELDPVTKAQQAAFPGGFNLLKKIKNKKI